jgi:hypothetical protein
VTSRSARLAARREQLIARSERLRLALTDDGAELADRFRLLDSVTAFARSGAGRVLLFGGAALVLLAGPRRALKVARRLALVWPLARPLLPEVLRYARAWRDRAARADAGSAADAGPAAGDGRAAGAGHTAGA